MAAYINIPRDFTRVKSKIIFNLTKRQLLCIGTAALFGVPAFFLIRRACGISFAVLGMVFVMLPFFFLGMYEQDGMPCEVLLRNFIRAVFIRPKTRPYQTENSYRLLMKQAETEKEVEKIVSAHDSGKSGKQGSKSHRSGSRE